MSTQQKNWWDSILSIGGAVVKKSQLGTAMDSILVLNASISLPCFIIVGFTHFWLILLIPFCLILYFFRAYDYYMKKNPGMLRSEKHEEKMFQIASMMGQKGQEIPETRLESFPAVSASYSIKKPELNSAKKRNSHA